MWARGQRRILTEWLNEVFHGYQSASFPSHPSLLNELVNKAARSAEMKVIHGLSNMDLHSPLLTWLWPPLSAQYGAIPQAAVWWQADCTGHFYHGRGSILSLLEWTLTIDTDLPSLRAILLPELSSWGFQNARSTKMPFHTALFLIKKSTSQQKKCSNGPELLEFTGRTHSPPS